MRVLSFAVALFAVAAFLVGLREHETMTFMLAGAAAASAATMFLGHNLSTFLKIFKVIFAVETIVFGVAYLIDHTGLWPADYEAYTLPDSLPLAVALFGVFVYAISFIPVIRKMTRIADPYFRESERTRSKIALLPAFTVATNKLAIASLVFLIVINQIEVAIDVRLSYFRNDMYNALKDMNSVVFWHQLFYVFVPVVTVYAFAVVSEYVVTSTFVIRWRRWLTGRYLNSWLGEGAHYEIALSGSTADNPDQRITEDIPKYIDGFYNYSVQILQNLTSLVSFAIVLWSLSRGFTLPGLDIVIPGVLFWVALVYTGAGTWLTHLIGRSLVRLNFAQQKREANFRFGLARTREYSEQIALLQGENAEIRAANGRFDEVFGNYMSIVHVRKKLTAFTFTYRQASVIIPNIVASPFYFAGKLNLGALLQVSAAFGNVNENLNFFVTSYTGLAEFRATLDRLTSFDGSIARARAIKAQASAIKIETTSSPDYAIPSLDLALPDGRALAHAGPLAFAAHEPTLVVGPSGAGKSTLFRAIAGIWPYGSGKIAAPKGRLMLLPQRPYIPIGPLSEAIAYPVAASTYSRDELIGALTKVGLGALSARLDESDNWQMRLSGGEQQRLAVARAVLANPDWLFLDEATASLDEDSEADLYRVIAQAVPQATIVSIGHRSTLAAFHTRRIEMQTHEGAPATIAG